MVREIRLGTSSFTADGWNGSFYPKGMKSADYLAYYSRRFDTVEVDSTFYRCPTIEAVRNWALKTPPGFIFSLKVPRTITHEKVLVDCDKEFEQFVTTVDVLGEKLGPMVLQFPFFNEEVFTTPVQFESQLKALIPIRSVAAKSNQPASKCVRITLTPADPAEVLHFLKAAVDRNLDRAVPRVP